MYVNINHKYHDYAFLMSKIKTVPETTWKLRVQGVHDY